MLFLWADMLSPDWYAASHLRRIGRQQASQTSPHNYLENTAGKAMEEKGPGPSEAPVGSTEGSEDHLDPLVMPRKSFCVDGSPFGSIISAGIES